MDIKPRVRFAPSPTGPLHIGGVRTALYNYLFAKKHGGEFILRIEDTDQTRFVEGAEEYIINSLKWLKITFDEGVHLGGPHAPYRQSERKAMYRQYAEQLVNDGHAYYAFDTEEELVEMREKLKLAKVESPQYNSVTRMIMKNSLTLPEETVKEKLAKGEPYVIRMKIPRNEEVKIFDLIRGWVVVNSSNVDDKVLFKSDGMPTYHLANVVDDYLMKITHVIRGEEWLPSTPLHVLLYRYLGWEESMPKFAHLPLLLKPDGNGKLSKRDGDRLGFPVYPTKWIDPKTNEIYTGFEDSGYFSESVVNMLAFFGWNPGTSQEIFTMDELIESFSIERIGKAGAKFDPDKAKWFNLQYLKSNNNEELAKYLQVELKLKGKTFSDEYVALVCGQIKERCSFVNELYNNSEYFFTDEFTIDKTVVEKKWKANTNSILKSFAERLSQLEPFTNEAIQDLIKKHIAENAIGTGEMLFPLRLVVTGTTQGPHVYEIIAILGKEESLKRIERFLNQ